MAENPLFLAMEGDTARITLNRPEARNAKISIPAALQVKLWGIEM